MASGSIAFASFEFQHMGSKESVAAKIDADTVIKIEEMNRSISVNRPKLIQELLDLVYDITPQLHKNYELQLKEAGNWVTGRKHSQCWTQEQYNLQSHSIHIKIIITNY